MAAFASKAARTDLANTLGNASQSSLMAASSLGKCPRVCATIETDLPGSKLSLTIARFSSADHRRQRSGPVNASITSCLLLVKNTVVCLPAILCGRLCPEIQGAAPLVSYVQRPGTYETPTID